MLAAILRSLVDRPGFIIASILAASFNLDWVWQTTGAVTDTAHKLRSIFRRVKFRLLLQIHIDRVLVLTKAPDISWSIIVIHTWRRVLFRLCSDLVALANYFGTTIWVHEGSLDPSTLLIDLLSVDWWQDFGLVLHWLELLLASISVSNYESSSILLRWAAMGRVLTTTSRSRLNAIWLAESLLLVTNLLLMVLEKGGWFVTRASHRINLLRGRSFYWRLIERLLRRLFDFDDLSLNQNRLILLKRVLYWRLREWLDRSDSIIVLNIVCVEISSLLQTIVLFIILIITRNVIDLSVERLRLDRFFGLVVSLGLTLRRLIADGTISSHESILLQSMRFV